MVKFWVVSWIIVWTSVHYEFKSHNDEFGRVYLDNYESLVVNYDTTYHQKEFVIEDSAINFRRRIRSAQMKDSSSTSYILYSYPQNQSQRILNVEMKYIEREKYNIGDSVFITFPMGGKFYLNNFNLNNTSKNILLSK